MAIIVDDLLFLPGTMGNIILNSLVQSSFKTAWIDYQRRLNHVLIRAKHDRAQGKLSESDYKNIEKNVFAELRIARKVLKGD